MWGVRRLAGVGLLAGLVATVAGPVGGAVEPRAPWPLLGSDFRVSGPAEGVSETTPAVAWNDAAGEYLVTWTEWRSVAPPGNGIYGRRVAGDGTRLGAPRRISQAWDWPTAEQSLLSAVAWNDGVGGYLVVWLTAMSTCGEHCEGIPRMPPGIWGRLLSADGLSAGTVIGFTDPGSFWEEHGPPAVAGNPADGEYLAVFNQYPGGASLDPAGLVAQRLSAAGALLGDQIAIRHHGYTPAAVWNPVAGEYLVVYQTDRRPVPSNGVIYGQRLTAAGTPAGGPFRVSGPDAEAKDREPSVVWNAAANDYLVVWEHWHNGILDVFGQRVGADGSRLGGLFRVNGRQGVAYSASPSVAWGGTSNQYLVVWADGRHIDSRGGDIYGRRLNADGTPAGDDFRISGRNATDGEAGPAVAWNAAANEFLVVWIDGRNAATHNDIYGRRVAG